MSRATEYIILSGLLALSVSARAGDIRVTGQFVSEATSGPPLVVNSTDKVTGLNADRLDGMTSADFATVADLSTPDSGVTVHYKNLQDVPGLEITQSCAEGSGCFAGDSGGFPVTITEPGSYRLASNLDVSALPDSDLIQIQSSSVTLDFKGFALLGPGSCSGTPVTSCTPTGSGTGVYVVPGLTNVTIRNGSIHGQTSIGILCESSCRVENMAASENRLYGIASTSEPSRASNCSTSRNGSGGILFFKGNVENSKAYGNGGNGIRADGIVSNTNASTNGGAGILILGGLAVNNTAIDNLEIGLQVSGAARGNYANGNGGSGLSVGGTARGNSAVDNGGSGIAIISGTAVGNLSTSNAGDGISGTGAILDNQITGNSGNGINATGPITANSIRDNQGDGIVAGRGSKISGNTVLGNTGDGVECSSDCLVLNNTIMDNGEAALRSVSNLLVWGKNLLRNNGAFEPVVGTTLSHDDNVCRTSNTSFC